MDQPVYWPTRSVTLPTRYQLVWESHTMKGRQGGHPRDQLQGIFGEADRVNDYTGVYPLAGVQASGGASVSFAGSLAENLDQLGAAGQWGYDPGWPKNYVIAAALKTPSGFPKLDLVQFSFHHGLMTLIDRNALDKEIGIHALTLQDTFGAGGSKGFFPAEMAFTPRLIDVLAAHGIEWSWVSNAHLSRACEDYPFVPSNDNIDPPNRADAINQAGQVWFKQSISRGCVPTTAVPFAYLPHRAKRVDPLTAKVDTVVVVPADMAMSWNDGYECTGPQAMQEVLAMAPATTARRLFFGLAHDGDNDFGGGYSFYNQCVGQLYQEAQAAGIGGTTVEQFLADNPVPPDDFVHVEDGSWVNDPGFGAPQSTNWNWPLTDANPAPGQFDIPHGWALNERNWAVITAAQNFVDSAEAALGGVDLAEVRSPTSRASPADLAWHFFLASLDSGFMYYGGSMDQPVKQTVACNLANEYARAALSAARGFNDTVPPTIWVPQRLPWNPGAHGMGALWGYKYTQFNTTDFWIWTFAADAVSGIDTVNLKYRIDDDGVNPIEDHANEVIDPASHGLSGVGPWITKPMASRAFPTTNIFNQSLDFTCDATGKPCWPTDIANEYSVKITGLSAVLVDYYIEATDKAGNTKISDLFHVWIATGMANV